MSRPESRSVASEAAEVFAALGDATRLGLVSTLCDGEPRSIARLASGLPLTRQAVTKHLKVLEAARIVRRDRVGRESRFVYRPGSVVEAHTFIERLSEQWDEALERLKTHVEQ